MVLALVACSESENKGEFKSLKRENETLSEALQSCKSALIKAEETQAPVYVQPTTPAEPECYEQDYDTLYVNSKKIDTCKSEDVAITECGVKATSCDSGLAYACLKDVTYKTETKKICE